jgi:pyridoxamine 5'-phosphate oxidase
VAENLMNINNLRKEYRLNKLTEDSVDLNPFRQFRTWFDEVSKSKLIEPNAMILSTANKQSIPSSRVVLLKNFDADGFIFFTNYNSRKGRELKENPAASLLFFWPELERQIRIEGKVKTLKREESEKYFHSRPRESQIAAWVSEQSSVIPDRNFLETKFKDLKIKFGNKEIPLPESWGGFRLVPDTFEFWQGRQNRLHDRICYRKKAIGWEIVRLSP